MAEYNRKRDFTKTSEPKGIVSKTRSHRFVVQEHHASKLHYDFRLEMDGVLKSWSVPRGPSLDPAQKRLAVMTEDHPVKYLTFEGKIPQGEYGGGEMRVWDSGTWEPEGEGDPTEQLEKGRVEFELKGKKLKGQFHLIQIRGQQAGDNAGRQWLLIKGSDKYAEKGDKVVPLLRGNTRTRPNQTEHGPSVVKVHTEGTGKPVKQVLGAKKPKGDAKVEVDGNIVALTSLDRVYFPEKKWTKADLLLYYLQVAETMLPYLQDRPLILKRYPLGVNGKFFFQHDVDEVPDFVETYTTKVTGHTVDYVVCENTATLLYLANMGVIPIHPWHSRVEDIQHPDWMVFDLDPGKVEFATVCETALAVKKCLDDLGLESYPKTSGSRGIHVYVPIEPRYSNQRVADVAERIAKLIVRENPEIATMVRSLGSRKENQIYIDHLQNAQGKTVVAPYSVRERAGATVSAPLDWKELRDNVTPADFTIKSMPKRIAKKGDVFAAVLTNKQRLEEAEKRLDKMDK